MKLISEKNPIDVFKEASKILYNAVNHTLGPSGLNTAVVYGKDIQANPKFQIINDGKTIIDNLTSTDAEVSCALQTIRESVLSTNNIAGDGTTSTIIMVYNLLHQLSNTDMVPFEICRQLKNIKKDILSFLPELSLKLGDYSLEQVAETSLGSDEYVDLFKKAFDFVGGFGDVLLEKSNDSFPTVEMIDGISMNQIGFVPELFLDAQGNINKPIDQCNTLLLKGDIKAFTSISHILLRSKETPILLFYDRMTTDVLRLLVQNLMKGGYHLYPVSLEGYGDEIMRYFTMLSLTTGGPIIDIMNTNDYNDPKLYGVLEGALFNKDALIIKPDSNKLDVIANYLKENKYILSTKTAIIKAGANNSIALEEQYRRFEDAIHSCSNAIRSGICLGGGLTYIKVADQLIQRGMVSKELGDILVKAFSSVYNKLLENCNVENVWVETVLHTEKPTIYLPKLDESTGIYKLDSEYKIYDSYKTIEQVLINSIDIVCSIFSTKILICDPQR